MAAPWGVVFQSKVGQWVVGRQPMKAHCTSLLKPNYLGIRFVSFSTATSVFSTVYCQIFAEVKGKFENIDGWPLEEAFCHVIHQSVNRIIGTRSFPWLSGSKL